MFVISNGDESADKVVEKQDVDKFNMIDPPVSKEMKAVYDAHKAFLEAALKKAQENPNPPKFELEDFVTATRAFYTPESINGVMGHSKHIDVVEGFKKRNQLIF